MINLSYRFSPDFHAPLAGKFSDVEATRHKEQMLNVGREMPQQSGLDSAAEDGGCVPALNF
jgi:hypothetical protein